ncbi:regulatory protein GemA [Glaesserella parasuis]|nr:regulatory protein GemA [Glaesserella parasuis]MDE4008374.1 regulatory protein GemA [Glaesserella parasuis]
MYAQTRKQMIQKIHIGKTELKMSDEAYKLFLMELVDKPSCSMMTDPELMIVLQGMRAKGFKVKSKQYGKRPTASNADEVRQGYIRKIEALIASSGKSWHYVHAICKRSFGIERLQWCTTDQIFKIVQMLAVNAHRNGRRT